MSATALMIAAHDYLDAKAAADAAAAKLKHSRERLDAARNGEMELAVPERHVRLLWVTANGPESWDTRRLKALLANWEDFRKVGNPSERLTVQPLLEEGCEG